MSMISTVLKTRNQHRYKYGKKLSAVLFPLLTFMPIYNAFAINAKCIDGYENIMYKLIGDKIKGVKNPGGCTVVVNIHLPSGLFVGDIKYTDTPECQRIAYVVKDISKQGIYRGDECYISNLHSKLWQYTLTFGKKEK